MIIINDFLDWAYLATDDGALQLSTSKNTVRTKKVNS